MYCRAGEVCKQKTNFWSTWLVPKMTRLLVVNRNSTVLKRKERKEKRKKIAPPQSVSIGIGWTDLHSHIFSLVREFL